MFTKMAGSKIAQIYCGDDIFDVTVQDKNLGCYFNQANIFNLKDAKIFGPIVGLLITSTCRVPNAKIAVKSNPGYADFLKGLIDTVSKSDQAKIKVLEDKPDEIADNKPKEATLNITALENYRNDLSTYCNSFDEVLTLSEILLKTKLPQNVYSFKEIGKDIAKLKAASNELNPCKEQYELAAEQSGSRIGQIITAIESKKLYDSQVKRIVQSAVNSVVSDFMTMKKLLASLLINQYPLYNIDKTFKKYTDYPATWFFDPSVYYNFTERYKDASDGLIEVMRSGASIVRPLYAWHIKVTGE